MPPAGPRRADSAPHASALQGRLAEISLFDICQFLMLNRKTGTLTARYEQQAVYLTFKDGQLLNAVDQTLRNGEAVILSAVQWPDGGFVFESGPVPPDRRIHSSTENVLLEAARLLDEMQAGDLLEADDDDREGGAATQGDGVAVGDGTGFGDAAGSDSSSGAAKARRTGGAGRPHSHVGRFQETQRRSAELSDAFRRAVSQDEETSLGAAWKESIVGALREGRAERLVVGPAGAIHLVHGNGVMPVEVPSFAEVEEWLAHAVPAPGEWSPFTGRSLAGSGAEDGSVSLWVTRESSAEGVWFTASVPSENFPDWTGMGFEEPLYTSMEQMRKGPVLLAASTDRLASQSAAAYLARRAAERSELSWVVERAPSYAWSRLPGRIRFLGLEQIGRPGALAALCDRTRPRLLVLRVARPDALLDEVLALADLDLEILLVGSGANPNHVMRNLEEGRSSEAGLRGRTLASALAGLWWVQAGSVDQPYPVRSRFLVDEHRARPAA